MNTSRGSSEEYNKARLDLVKASKEGDWKAAKDILDKHEELVRVRININLETALHVAAYAGHTLYVENLVNLMEDADLKLKNSSSNTALCLAVQAGHLNIAKILVAKYKHLLYVTGSHRKSPLHMAAVSGKRDMVMHLYGASKRMKGCPWTNESRGGILLACVVAELFDVARQILKDFPKLAVSQRRILGELARNPRSFKKKSNLIKKYVYLYDTHEERADDGNQAVQFLRTVLANIPKPKLDDMLREPAHQIIKERSFSSVLFVAAQSGNAVFIEELIRHNPRRVVELNEDKQSIFHVAVSYRHAGVYNLVHDIGSVKDLIINLEDENGNNLLHLVGIFKDTTMGNQSQYLQGPAVQMEQERQWFMMVSDMLPPSLREKKNKAGERPRELFTKNHKELLSEAVSHVEKKSLELMVVASGIATISSGIDIAFIGKPMFSRKNFNWYMVWNGISLLLAYSSIFLALSIVRSSYAERDFFSSSLHKFRSGVLVVGVSFLLQILAFFNIFIRLFQDISPTIPYLMLIPAFAILVLFLRRFH